MNLCVFEAMVFKGLYQISLLIRAQTGWAMVPVDKLLGKLIIQTIPVKNTFKSFRRSPSLLAGAICALSAARPCLGWCFVSRIAHRCSYIFACVICQLETERLCQRIF